jgi:hypothetical protein
MAFTQSDLDRIDKAISSGQKVVQLNGRRKEFQSIDDMLKARQLIQQELNTSAGEASGNRRPRGYRAVTRKGL